MASPQNEKTPQLVWALRRACKLHPLNADYLKSSANQIMRTIHSLGLGEAPGERWENLGIYRSGMSAYLKVTGRHWYGETAKTVKPERVVA